MTMTLQSAFSKMMDSEELFLDTLLREAPNGADKSHLIDLTKADWLSDFQLTCLPFVLSEIKKRFNDGQITLRYLFETLFDEDKFFDYLSASGFFDFVSDVVKVETPSTIRSAQFPIDPLLNFQAFRNVICHDGRDNESQRILFELSSNLEILSELFNKEIFGRTDVGNKMARVVAKELIENINQHSKSSKALVRLKFESDYQIILRQYGKTSTFRKYLEKNEQHGFLLLTVSDDGLGIVNTLKGKYETGYFLPNADETLPEMLGKQTKWWLERAFQTHLVKNTNMRIRLGLKAIRDTIVDYDGALYVRTGDASYLLTKEPELKACESNTYLNPYISGTHFLVMLPAKERRKNNLEKVKVYTQHGISSFSELKDYDLESFDIALHYKQNPVTSNILANEKYITKTISSIVSVFKNATSKPTTIIEIDFSNGINYKAQDYVHILTSVDKALGTDFTSKAILRNVSDEMITELSSSPFAEHLQKSNRFLLTFDNLDKLVLIGCKDKQANQELCNILSGQIYTPLQLSPLSIKYIENNGILIFFAIFEGSESALAIKFNQIFKTNFSIEIANEIDRSKSLLSGPFHVSSGYHVDKYLVAQAMFKNPIICRKYAKEIAKALDGVAPTLLVSYSTSGIILYWYLKYHYFPNLGLSIVSGPNDVTHVYGRRPTPTDRLLLVTDVMLTGNFMVELREYLEKCECTPEAVSLEVAIFKLGNLTNENCQHTTILHHIDNVLTHTANDCGKANGGAICSSVASPESGSLLPTAYEQHQSIMDNLLERRTALDKIDDRVYPVPAQYYPSLIDDQNMSNFELLTYWRAIQGALQMGHVERAHTHFDIYDIPERLLFKKRTAVQIENYIKKFAWSFKDFIHYVIFPNHLTAAYLAHILGSKFINKPIVAEVTRLPTGRVILPESLRTKLDATKNVVVVDDASNTGTTLKEIIGLLLLYEVNILGVFTLTNRIHPESEAVFRRITPKIASAYRMNLGVYPSGGCPICNRLRQLETKLKEAATSEYRSYLANEIDKVKLQPYEK